MEMKKNGFTLIELLAVILILGIIALIAIPTVNNIIDDSKKRSFETSINNIVKAIEGTCQIETITGKTLTTSYTFTDGNVSPKLNIKGKLPTSGTATVDSNCNVTITASDGKFTATKNPTDDSAKVGGGSPNNTLIANGSAIYFNPVTGVKCTEGQATVATGTKTGCMKWYAFNDSITNSNINLILAHNTTANVSWNSSYVIGTGPINLLQQLKNDTSGWLGVPVRTDIFNLNNGEVNYTINYNTYRARLITIGEIAQITGNTSVTDNNAFYTDYFYLNTNSKTNQLPQSGKSNYAWLFNYTKNCTSYGCNYNDANVNGYWTATAVKYGSSSSSEFFNSRNKYRPTMVSNNIDDKVTILAPEPSDTQDAWYISFYGEADYGIVAYTTYGVRPVITIPKSLIN